MFYWYKNISKSEILDRSHDMTINHGNQNFPKS